MNYEAVIGLEIHIELNSPTKMFCDCPNNPSDSPNKNICPICLWLPGAIPKFSNDVLEKSVKLCLGLNCEIQKMSAFDQKVYYYPDLPKGFQLSQAHFPLAKKGWVEVSDKSGETKKLRIRHIHLEEDVAKLVHEIEGKTPISLVDFNRAGVPLVEIVSEPDIRTSEEAMEFIKNLRNQVRYVGGAECSMEQGSMRVDANISIRQKDTTDFNTKVEVKNMNSVRSVGDAINYEIERQTAKYEAGEEVILHTRLWDPDKSVTTPMRAKFEGPCVPDPTVSKIVIDDDWLKKMQTELPEMPQQRIERLKKEYKLNNDEAFQLCSEIEIAEYFESALKISQNVSVKTIAIWIITQLLPALKENNQSITNTTVTPERFIQLLLLIEKNEITVNSAKKVLTDLFKSDASPEELVDKNGLRQVSDENALTEIIKDVLEKNSDAVEKYKLGNKKVRGFIVGQVMRASQGKANPQILQKILTELLDN
jgi:aspartyl-tRNA(Asn)/glutamyl-tRNA(Gln) amidotransferase subunit B